MRRRRHNGRFLSMRDVGDARRVAARQRRRASRESFRRWFATLDPHRRAFAREIARLYAIPEHLFMGPGDHLGDESVGV